MKSKARKPDMPQKPRSGLSRLRYEGEWCPEEFNSAIISLGKIAIDIPTQGENGEPDTVTVTAVSLDNGKTYTGNYRYMGTSYDPGQVEFVRTTQADGVDVFKGRWIANTGERDSWILEAYPQE